jgi:hypothetical protein
MNKTIFNFIVDAAAFAAFLFLATTGVLMRYVLPPGSGHFSALWGLDRHDWGAIHFWIAITLTIVMVLHLFLHWRWIVCTVQGRPREGSGVRVALAVIVLLAFVGLAISPFFSPVESNHGTPPHKMQSGEQPKELEHQINGSMTLEEVERVTGVPATAILKELGLPDDLPKNEQLGRLRKKFGFEMEAVRKAVQAHNDQQGKRGTAP